MRTVATPLLLLAVALSTAACTTYSDDLTRAQAHFQANEHERALALFRALERDTDSFSHVQFTKYCYLRGMTDYRLGTPYRADARHWLALARAHEKEQPGGLEPGWKKRMAAALRDLNQDVYGQGVVPEGESADAAEADDSEQPAATSDKEPAEEQEAKPSKKKKSED